MDSFSKYSFSYYEQHNPNTISFIEVRVSCYCSQTDRSDLEHKNDIGENRLSELKNLISYL